MTVIETRKITKVLKSKLTNEGAGVHLKRAFGFSQVPLFDPFLLLDDFRGPIIQSISQRVSLASSSWYRDDYLCSSW